MKATSKSSSAITVQPMAAPPPKAGDKLVRNGATSGRPGQIVSAANRWRENYDPMRGLNMRRVAELFELGQRGDTAWLQWMFRFIERRNPTLSGLLSRCEAPLAHFDWSIKKKALLPAGVSKDQFARGSNAAPRAGNAKFCRNVTQIPSDKMSEALSRSAADLQSAGVQRAVEPSPEFSAEQLQAMADEQLRTLDDAYNAIDNLRQAILHLHLAFFRGYAHLQKHRNPDGDVYHLEPLDQWCVCRDGLYGNWWWNPDSRSTSAPLQFLGPDFCIGGDKLPLDDFIILESARPIDEIGLVDTVRRALCEKDWDGFLEIYGIPGGVVIMPPNVQPGREGEYEQTAKQVAEGAPGALPYGSDYRPNDHARSVDPFTPRLKNLDEQLILAGTGGLLTMMTEHGGGGNVRGSSQVHDRAFGEIADGRARAIAEIFQKHFDAEVLAKFHPGEPVLVYFDFGAEKEEDIVALCQNVAVLKTAGFTTDAPWLSEKSGIPVTVAATPPSPKPEDKEENEDEEESGNLESAINTSETYA